MSEMESIIGRATNPDEWGDCWKYAAQDRAFLLQRIAELEADVNYKEEFDALCGRFVEAKERIQELEAEVNNLKAIIKGEGGTKKVSLDDRYDGGKVHLDYVNKHIRRKC